MPISITISANVVAWYAALISTGLLVVHYLKFRAERVNVVIECAKGYRVRNSGIYSKDKEYILVNVINKGVRPVTIKTVACITKKKNDSNFILADSIDKSRELTEGKSTHYLMEQDSVDLKKVKYFAVFDLTGREFRGKLKN